MIYKYHKSYKVMAKLELRWSLFGNESVWLLGDGDG